MTALEPFFVADKGALVPNEIAQGGWGPTLGGQVVGGLLARAVEAKAADPDLVPVRLTVDILRRVATAPVEVTADVVRVGRRMQALEATMTQHDEIVARASTLYLRPSEQPADQAWTMPVSMPPIPEEPERFDPKVPMFIRAYGRDVGTGGSGFEWQHDGPRFAWLREVRDLVAGETMSPFVRAALAVDVTAAMTGGPLHRACRTDPLQRQRNCGRVGESVRRPRPHRHRRDDLGGQPAFRRHD